MNIYNIFTTLIVVLAHLLHTNDHRTLAPLLKAPEPDTTYSICYIITPPATPLTIDPSPPVLAPPFDPDHAPIPPYTHMGATSAGHGTNSFSVNWLVNLLVVIVSGLLVHEAIAWFILYVGNGPTKEASSVVQDHPPSPSAALPDSTTPSPTTPFPPSPPPFSVNVGPFPQSALISTTLYIPTVSPIEVSDRVVLSSRSICAAAPSSSLDSPVKPPVSTPDSDTGATPPMPSMSSMPSLHSSSLSEDGRSDVMVPFNDDPAGSIASTAAPSVRNFLDEITLTLSPSPSFITRTPPVVLTVPTNLWEDLVDIRFIGESSVWDCYPRPTPRTPVALNDDAIESHDQCVDTAGVAEPLVRVWTMDTNESPTAPTRSPQNAKRTESTAEFAGFSQAASTRIPKLAPTSIWKKSISALISGYGKRATRSVPALVSATQTVSTDAVVPTSKKLDWSEDVEQALSSYPRDIATEDETAGLKGDKWVRKIQGPVLEKCNCALKTAHFEPECWNRFKIPASCHPRPPIHFFSPRDTDKCNPSTRIVVDNVNAFRHQSTEPNLPYVNKDIEGLFYSVGAKDARCFDGRIVEGVLRYGTSYAVVDFEMVEDAMTAFKILQGRKAYPDSFHLRLKFVDVDDRTFGRRMAVSLGPMKRSEEERSSFAEFVEDLDRVDVNLARVVRPRRPGFTLPPRPDSEP